MVPTDPVESGRTLALVSHLGVLAGGFPLPLVIRLTEGKENEFVRHHSAEALNFQITFMIAWLSVFVVFFASALADIDSAFLALFFLVAMPLWIANYAFSILGAVRASQKKWWRYPISIRFVRGARRRSEAQPAGASIN
jgi:uncharacterized Tic20 family protein